MKNSQPNYPNLINCSHSPKDRAFNCTIVISEINYGLSLGYQIIKIYEAHIFKEKSKILKDFIKILTLKKLESSYGLIADDISKLTDFLELSPNLSLNFNENPNEAKKFIIN